MIKKRPSASHWKCDETGLFILTPTGPVEIYIDAISLEEVRYFYHGRDYIYERKFAYACRRYEHNPGTPGEHWRKAVVDLSRSLMHAHFAMLQPGWVRSRPFIWVDGEKLVFQRISQRYFAFSWNEARYAFFRNDEGDIEISAYDKDAMELPESLCASLLWFAVRIWHAIPVPVPLPRFDAERYNDFVSMENPMRNPRKRPAHVESAYQRLAYAERNGHPVEEIDKHRGELHQFGKRGAEARKQAPPASETSAEALIRRENLIRENEARAMGLERGDHLLPPDERPEEFRDFAA
ncbi:MAG: hypothetical protein V4682_00975 [Patescibacteria group bacterium]